MMRMRPATRHLIRISYPADHYAICADTSPLPRSRKISITERRSTTPVRELLKTLWPVCGLDIYATAVK